MDTFSRKDLANLPLQMSLYFNVYFFPFWLILTIILFDIKYNCLATMYQFILPTILAFVILLECFRLYLGYVGNLSEKVAELTGFWLLSVFLQFPMQMFLLLDENTKPLPPERAIHSIMIIFLIVQVVTGYSAIRHLSTHQAALYQLTQFYRTDHHEKAL